MADYRIEYTIQRSEPGADDFTDIGFGSSCSWPNVDAALYAIESDIQNRQWETSAGMPDPNSVDAGAGE